jgi:hypothetical protein
MQSFSTWDLYQFLKDKACNALEFFNLLLMVNGFLYKGLVSSIGLIVFHSDPFYWIEWKLLLIQVIMLWTIYKPEGFPRLLSLFYDECSAKDLDSCFDVVGGNWLLAWWKSCLLALIGTYRFDYRYELLSSMLKIEALICISFWRALKFQHCNWRAYLNLGRQWKFFKEI